MVNKFHKITEELQIKGINVEHYRDFLNQQKTDSASRDNSLSDQKLQQTQLLPIQNIGSKLLEDAKINIEALNQILKKTSNLSPRNFLQLLLKERKIKVEEFLTFEQNTEYFNSQKQSRYRIRLQQNQPEFYLLPTKNGKIYGNYQIFEELARGGMGIIYKAYHLRLNQLYALKVLIAGTDASEQNLKRFHREIQSIARLKHPNIIQIIDSGSEGGEHYFVMEYIEGETLENWYKKEPSIRDRILLFKKCLNALHYAHSEGIMHRDLKPENILITRDGEPKLTDFGLARDITINQKSQKLTQTGVIMGTPAYMSPEQACGKNNEVDVRSDIYSMGTCLYEMLTHKLPFSSSTIHLLLQQILNQEPTAPSKLKPEIHKDLDTIILKSLHKSKNKRYQTAKEFEQDIARFLDGYSILARPIGYFEKVSKWGQRNRHSVIVASIVLLLCLALALFFSWKRHQQNQKTFEGYLKQAKEAKLKSDASQGDSEKRKMEHLMEALNFLNMAILTKPNHLSVEETKFKIGKKLIYLACESREYRIAEYLARDLQRNSSIGIKEKQKLFVFIKQAQSEKLKQHKKRLNYWLKELKKVEISQWNREIALLEISKMQEPEILEKLLEILKEGNAYFLEETQKSSTMENYYKTFALGLGRLENPAAGKHLLHALFHMREKLVKTNQKLIPDTLYMIALFQGIAYSKTTEAINKLSALRFEMGQNGLFWKETEAAFQMLSGIEPKKSVNSKLPENENDLNNEAFKKYAAKDFKGAIEIFSKVIELYPNSASGYTNRGVVYFAMKQYPKAIADQNKALQLKPDHFKAYFNRGNAKRDNKDTQGAIQDYNETIRLKPDFAHAFLYRGSVFKGKKEYQKAIKDIEKAIELNPKLAKAYSIRADYRFIMQQYKEAFQDCKTTLKINSQVPEAYIIQAKIQILYQQYEKAILDTTKAISISPRYGEGYKIRGIAKKNNNDVEGAIQDLTQAIDLNSNDIQAYFERASCFTLKNLLEKAIQDYNKVIQLDPFFSFAYYNRGTLEYLKKNYSKAELDFSKVIQIDPNNYNAYYLRGNAKLSQNKIGEAKKDFQALIKITKPQKFKEKEEIYNFIFTKFPELKKHY